MQTLVWDAQLRPVNFGKLGVPGLVWWAALLPPVMLPGDGAHICLPCHFCVWDEKLTILKGLGMCPITVT